MDSQNKNAKIELTDLELAVLKKDIAGEFFPPEATEEERNALKSVIDKADKHCEDMDAYDEIGNRCGSLTSMRLRRLLESNTLPGKQGIRVQGNSL